MIYKYDRAKILMLTDGRKILIDGTTQEIKQRLSTLRNYYRSDEHIHKFLHNCYIHLIEYFPCKSRFELSQRVKFYEVKLGLEQIDEPLRKMPNIKAKNNLQRKNFITEPTNLTVNFD